MDTKRGHRAWLGVCFVMFAGVAASGGGCSSTDTDREPTGSTRAALTTQIPVSADTYLKQGTPNQNQGTLTTLRLQASGHNRAILRASPSDLANLTPGATVRLELTIADNGENWSSEGRPIGIHRLTSDWTELGATWNCAVDTNTANSSPDCAGATAWEMDKPNQPELHPWVATPTATARIFNTSTGTVSFDVTSDVELFRSGNTPNYGWLIKKVDEGQAGRVEFASRETPTPPVLVGSCSDTVEAGVCDPADGGTSTDSGGGSTDAAEEVPPEASVDAPEEAPTCNTSTCVATAPCTQAACVGSSCVITSAADGSPCDDTNACTSNDVCSSGTCAGTPVDPADSLPCSIDSCDPLTGVHHDPAPASTPCTTGSTCTTNDHCSGTTTACVGGTPVPVDDRNPCTADSCVEGVGVVHQPISHCDPTPLADDVFEQHASVIGKLSAGGSAVTGASFTVLDLPISMPRSDVVVSTSSDGSFRLRLTTFQPEAARTPPKHVLVRVEHPGFLDAFRDVWLHTGDAVDLGVIKLVALDSNVTPIGPAGGTATDSQNRIQLIVPPGALATTVPIVITPIPLRDEMPAPLPDSTSTLYGFSFMPSGTTFAVPATVRLQNWRNAPTAIPIPVGYFDEVAGRWESEAQAVWDGTRFAFQTTHFSTRDANYATPTNLMTEVSLIEGDPKGPCQSTGSSCETGGGSLEQTLPLPVYGAKGEAVGLSLGYESGPASSWKLGDAPSNYGAVAHSTFSVPLGGVQIKSTCVAGQAYAILDLQYPPTQPGKCASSLQPGAGCTLGTSTTTTMSISAFRSIAGSLGISSVNVKASNNTAEYDTYVDLPNVSEETTARGGLHRMRTVAKADAPGACVGPGETFGVSDPSSSTEAQTNLEPGPLATFDTHVLLRQRVTSPFGSGWALREASRVYRAGDVAHLSSGDGSVEIFRPRMHAKALRTDVFRFAPARDPQTGEIFLAQETNSTIVRVDPITGATTNVLSGLGFDSPVHGLAVAYVGGQRRFIVALSESLREISGTGSTRILTTRFENIASQASVATRGTQLFYTDGIGPTLFRIELTDPARTVEAMTLATGGDVRLYPHETLSGVRFAAPQGLAFGLDGTLYMSDRRRNTVYAIRPEAAGTIGGASHVDVAVGDGGSGLMPPVGEAYPGQALSVRWDPLESTCRHASLSIL